MLLTDGKQQTLNMLGTDCLGDYTQIQLGWLRLYRKIKTVHPTKDASNVPTVLCCSAQYSRLWCCIVVSGGQQKWGNVNFFLCLKLP